MKGIKTKLLNLVKDEEGLELSEYAVAGSLIVLGTVAAFTLLSGNIATVINSIAGRIVVPGGGGGTP